MDNDDYISMEYVTFYDSNKKVAVAKTKLKEKKEVKEELYEIHGNILGVRYGIKLAENSQGKWVMEIKGTGVVEAHDPSLITKVVPYTIAVQFAPKGQKYHYLAKAGEHQVGDFYIVEGYQGGNYQLAHIAAVNTQSDAATKEFAPIKKIS